MSARAVFGGGGRGFRALVALRDRLRARRERSLEAEREPEGATDGASGTTPTTGDVRSSSTDPLATTFGASGDDLPTGSATESWPQDRQAPEIVQEGDEDEGPDPMIGRVLSGLYKVDRRIGEGGMGQVYLALHIHLDKAFAVKVLSGKVASNKGAVERLRQEARAAGSIKHDNIVDVVNFDVMETGDVFLVMEMLEGKSLAEVIEEGPMSLERALPIAYQLCDGLQAAHDNGIVHRDLKPENVFICRKRDADFVKILDFGISKIKTAEAEKVRMTRTGQLVGTPLYMSPEQARGEADIDHRADVYAMGVMLYEMLTGRPPFEGGNYFQLLWKHGNEAPRPPSELVGMPPGIEAAILRSLAKTPDERWPSMKELGDALAAAAPEVPLDPGRLMSLPPRASAPTPTPDAPVADPDPVVPASSRTPWIVAAVVLLLGVAGAAYALGGGGSSTGETSEVSEPEGGERQAEPEATEATEATETTETTEAESTMAAVLPEGVEPPRQVRVRFVSTPTGAVVRRGDERLGQTPFELDLPPDERFEVQFSLPNHRSRSVPVEPVDGAEVDVRLQRRAGGGSMTMSGAGHRTML